MSPPKKEDKFSTASDSASPSDPPSGLSFSTEEHPQEDPGKGKSPEETTHNPIIYLFFGHLETRSFERV